MWQSDFLMVWQGAVLTSSVTVFLHELLWQLSRVGMKLVPLLRRLTKSAGSSCVVKL